MTDNEGKSEHVAREINDMLLAILGLDAGTALDATQPLSEIGLDSLLAMDLIVALESKFGVELEDTVHVDHPTIAELTAHISRRAPRVPGA